MKAQQVGKALVITSGLKTADIERAEKICPEALVLREESERPIFRVGFSKRGVGIGMTGIVFDSTDAAGNAQMTLVQDKPISKDKLADDYGLCFIRLTEVEAQFIEVYGAASRALTAAVADVEGVE